MRVEARVPFGAGRFQICYRLRCVVCGAERTRHTSHLRYLASHCPVEAAQESSGDEGHAYSDGVTIDRWTSWAEDDRCWYVVECHPDGLSLDQVGELMDMSREAVRQIEASARAKLRDALAEIGLTEQEVLRAYSRGD